MKKLLTIAFFCGLSFFAHAEVQVEVDASEVNITEPFRLTLTQNDLHNGGGVPDLTPLRKDFFILGSERSVNYALINGQSQSSSTWTITLKAQKAGIQTIPAIKIGSEHTTPLTINITSGTTSQQKTSFTNDQQQDILLTTEVNEKKPYVNQQITYKVAIYNSKQLLDASYQGPKVENALLIPLSSGKRYQTQKNGVQYLVEEQEYAVFPQKSGTLKISSPVFTALVYDFNPQRVQVENKPIKLEIQPIPKQFSGKEWLPAKEVKLSDRYENTDQSITQGSTLIRTVILEGTGIPAQLLPTPTFAETDAFNTYPEKGQDNNQVQQGELKSRVEIKVTYLFNKSGKITIPELKLPWFNTTTGKEEVATLAAKVIEVSPSGNTPAPTTKIEPAAISSEKTIEPVPNSNLSTTSSNNWAWLIAAFFALAWIVTIILWVLQKRNSESGKSADKKALQQIQKSCTEGNPHAARDALLKWANLHWPNTRILNITQLAQLIDDEALEKQIQLLSHVLYQHSEKQLWHGDELWHSIQQAIKPRAAEKRSEHDILPPVNPV